MPKLMAMVHGGVKLDSSCTGTTEQEKSSSSHGSEYVSLSGRIYSKAGENMGAFDDVHTHCL